jgi:hypothetical protein
MKTRKRKIKKKSGDIEIFKKSLIGTLLGFSNLILLIILTWITQKIIIFLNLNNDSTIYYLNLIAGIFGGLNLILTLSYGIKEIIKILIRRKK